MAQNNCSSHYDDFDLIYAPILNFHDPKTKKQIRGNQKPQMNKQLKKALLNALD